MTASRGPLMGRVGRPRCPYCRMTPGSDCLHAVEHRGQVRARERREWRRDEGHDIRSQT